MTARMVATHRRYTRQQKGAYRARLRRRHLHGHAHRLPLRLDTSAFADAASRATERVRALGDAFRDVGKGLHPDELVRQLGEWQPKTNASREHQGVPLPTAEELLGMVRERGGTLDEILNLPSLPRTHPDDIPEGWSHT